MALTTPKMSLSVWNQLTDSYDHTQLADNFSKLDFHDHTPGRGVLIPTEGIADGAVTAPKLASSLDPTLGYNVYKEVIRVRGSTAISPTALTYIVPISGGTAAAAGTGSLVKDVAFYLDPADYAVSGKSTVLRGRAFMGNNSVAPATTFTFGLYPVSTVSGTQPADLSVAAIGSVIAGSTVQFVSPSASALTSATTTAADFVAPAAGYYVIGVVNSGSSTANSKPTFAYHLQVRQV